MLLTAAICIVTACEQEFKSHEAGPVNEESGKEAPTRAIVRFSDEMVELIGEDLEQGRVLTKSSELNDFVEAYGIADISPVFIHNERFAERHRRAGLHKWFYIEYDSSKLPVTKAVDALSALPGVDLAEPERKISNHIFDDPDYGKQWHLKQSNGIDINVDGVWLGYTTGSPDVIVAVIDGGIDMEHPDLKDSTLPGGMGLSRNFVSGTYAVKGEDHGTHVAGIIGAVSNNGIGITGIAGGDAANGKPGVTLMSCQIFETQGDQMVNGGTPAAIVWAADNGAVICQNSWGYSYDENGDGKLDASELEVAKNDQISASDKTAVDYFIQNAGCDEDGNQLPDSPMKGGVVIFAAGNDAIEYGHPANYEAVIAVGSIAPDGTRSSFSNFGDWVDICAPGSDVYSTVVGGGYRHMSGTSMACPVVSGVAALVLSQRGGLGFTNEMLKDCLLKGASSDKITATGIGPFVDAMGAIAYGMDAEAPQPISSFSTEVHSNFIDVTWEVPEGVNENPAYGATIYVSTDKEAIDNLDPSKPAAGVKYANVVTYNMAVGEKVTGTISRLGFETEYYVTVVSYNYGPAYAEVPPAVKVVTTTNNAPVIAVDKETDNIVMKSSETLNLTFTVEDPDGHVISVAVNDTAAEKWTRMSQNSYVLRITAKDAEDGRHRVSMVVEDEFKARTEYAFEYEVLPNHAPVTVGELENVLMSMENVRDNKYDISGYFSDPDGDLLSYTVTNSAPGVVHATVTQGVLYLTPRDLGKAELIVSAADSRGLKASQTIKVAVREDVGGVDIYPTNVVDFLYVGTGAEESQTRVRVVSATGQEVCDMNLPTSVFNPAKVDMNDAPPGVYAVKVVYEGTEYSQNIVKL